jgi:hypothetical protein
MDPTDITDPAGLLGVNEDISQRVGHLLINNELYLLAMENDLVISRITNYHIILGCIFFITCLLGLL